MTRFHGKNKIKWFCVTEQTPTETGYYFVCHDNSLPAHSRYSIEQWLHSENDWNPATHNKSAITHWAYLPDLPDGFNDEE
jgi:hypothetical protein